MTGTLERKIRDVCKKEAEYFAGSLKLTYSGRDYTGCSYAGRDYTGCNYIVEVIREDICLVCC